VRGFWTARRDDILRVAWRDGVSLHLIARMIGDGCTRNAVVGRKNRLRLPERETKTYVHHTFSTKRTGYPTKRKHSAKTADELLVRVKKRKAAPASQPPVVAAPTPPCTLMELSYRRCRWPVGELYCGMVDPEINSRRPYCCEHSKIAYGRQPKPPFKRRLPSGLAPASTYYGSIT
jgi:GcrA cell cycle regulator